MDLDAIRIAIAQQFAAAITGLNAYPYPDGQIEYPAMILPTLDQLAFHAVAGGGATIDIRAELVVGDGDTSAAIRNLEILLGSARAAAEDSTSESYVNVVAHGASNFRTRNVGELSCDLVLTIHV